MRGNALVRKEAVRMGDLLNLLGPDGCRGSKPRCHLLTHGTNDRVAGRLTEIAAPRGLIRPDHLWGPRGFEDVKEPRLDERPPDDAPGFLTDDRRERVLEWWLEVRSGANTPNWDIASTCEIQGRSGLMLVEAKAHTNELSDAGKPRPSTPNGWRNHERIAAAIQEANTALNRIVNGWALSRDYKYQLSNRFAWAYKLASLGVPVLLIYLGFLDADEMHKRGGPFRTANDWERAVRDHAAGVVPEGVWGEDPLDVGGTPLWALIRSQEIALPS